MIKKKVLVTGAAGFIGSHLCERLLKDYRVIGVDNLSLGKKENISHLKGNDFKFYHVEILDPKEFEQVFRIHSFDAIFHLAANSDISNPDPKKDFQNTLSTTLVLLEKCRIRGIKEFIFTSSGAVYGETKKIVKEDDGPLFPISHYGACKLSSEAFISSYSSLYGIQSWICRLPNVIGERVTHGVIFDFIKQLRNSNELHVLGNGEQSKPYMYVKDCVDAMVFIWQNAKDRINYYNLSGLGETKVKDIAEMVSKALGSEKITYQERDRGWDGDIPYYKCEVSKLGLLGWVPKRTSDDAVKLTIKKLI